MKKIILSFFSLISFVSIAQIKVEEKSEGFSVGNQNALIVKIAHSDREKVEKAWKTIIKDFHPDDVNNKKHEYFFDNAKFTGVSANAIDVYSIVQPENENEMKLMACFDLGGAYANSSSHGDIINYFKKMMHDFAVKMAKENLEDKIQDETKVLSKFMDKQESLEKENKNLHLDIIDYNERVKKANEKIELNKKEIEVKKTEVSQQHKKLDDLKMKLSDVK
jgi:hypothetical protein